MSKPRMSGADIERYEAQKREIKHLKRTIARLEKQLARVDVDRFQNLQEAVDAVEKEDKQFHSKNQKDILREKWKCFKCQEGYLRLVVFNRLDGVWYQRRCTQCGKKTKLQKYNDTVEGIKE